jgi:hypothetical protein
MMNLRFDTNATSSPEIEREVRAFLAEVPTLEASTGQDAVIFQDGVNGSYYTKCNIAAAQISALCDLNARLVPEAAKTFRANRMLLREHGTFKRMRSDAEKGREFNDIVVEYNKAYTPTKPLKVWGGQHRVEAIREAHEQRETSRYHGFRVFFALDKKQRSELALFSNTNIRVSEDLFDRLTEDTLYYGRIRDWCQDSGLLPPGEDFPDSRGSSELFTVKLARTFIVNFYAGSQLGSTISADLLDNRVYAPALCESGGPEPDRAYSGLIEARGEAVWTDPKLRDAATAFARLHGAQRQATKGTTGLNRKGYRNKALVESVLAGWAFVAGLLQSHPERLANHFSLPSCKKDIPDPLNARFMSDFKHDFDPPTYRGLGTRSSAQDRTRMAQVFLARTLQPRTPLSKKLIREAVSTVIGLQSLVKGYTK